MTPYESCKTVIDVNSIANDGGSKSETESPCTRNLQVGQNEFGIL